MARRRRFDAKLGNRGRVRARRARRLHALAARPNGRKPIRYSVFSALLHGPLCPPRPSTRYLRRASKGARPHRRRRELAPRLPPRLRRPRLLFRPRSQHRPLLRASRLCRAVRPVRRDAPGHGRVDRPLRRRRNAPLVEAPRDRPRGAVRRDPRPHAQPRSAGHEAIRPRRRSPHVHPRRGHLGEGCSAGRRRPLHCRLCAHLHLQPRRGSRPPRDTRLASSCGATRSAPQAGRRRSSPFAPNPISVSRSSRRRPTRSCSAGSTPRPSSPRSTAST